MCICWYLSSFCDLLLATIKHNLLSIVEIFILFNKLTLVLLTFSTLRHVSFALLPNCVSTIPEKVKMVGEKGTTWTKPPNQESKCKVLCIVPGCGKSFRKDKLNDKQYNYVVQVNNDAFMSCLTIPTRLIINQGWSKKSQFKPPKILA